MFLRKCLAVLSAVVLLLALSVGSVSAEDNLTVYAGAVFFNNPVYDTVVLVEFPFTLSRDQFEFFRPDTSDPRYYARIFAQLDLFGVDGSPVDSITTYFSAAINTPAEAAVPDYKLFNALSLPIKPGVYSARLTVIDVKSKVEGHFNYERIIVEPGRNDVLSIGGKCLAYKINYVGDDPEAEHDRMVKNGFRVMCNPLGVFDRKDSSMCFYAELYNLAYEPDDTTVCRISYRVLREDNEVERNYGFKMRHKPGNTLVITDCLDISDLLPGQYRLQIIATDSRNMQTDTALMAFHVLTPEDLMAQVEDDTQFDPYDTLSLAVKLNLVKYLLTPVDHKRLESLTDEGKERFLVQYWKENDPDPTTPINESRIEMLQRYLYCNAMFSSSVEGDDGWRSDRGRIYMTYGRYDERDDVQTPRTGNPFEIWYYRKIREGAVFVFEDKQGYHDYTLVHSNVDGEKYSSDWQRKIEDDLYRVN